MVEKKHIALEWLYLLGGVAFGLIVSPSLVYFAFAVFFGGLAAPAEYYPNFYSALAKGPDQLFAWIVVLGPYVLFQLVRSVRWAWKAARPSP